MSFYMIGRRRFYAERGVRMTIPAEPLQGRPENSPARERWGPAVIPASPVGAKEERHALSRMPSFAPCGGFLKNARSHGSRHGLLSFALRAFGCIREHVGKVETPGADLETAHCPLR